MYFCGVDVGYNHLCSCFLHVLTNIIHQRPLNFPAMKTREKAKKNEHRSLEPHDFARQEHLQRKKKLKPVEKSKYRMRDYQLREEDDYLS